MVAIAYGKGVIAAQQYFRRIKADTFSSFVHENFESMFKKWSKEENCFCKMGVHHKVVVKPLQLGVK